MVLLRYVAGLKNAEIALALGVSEGTVAHAEPGASGAWTRDESGGGAVISQLDRELEARLSAAFVRADEQDWDGVRARATRGDGHASVGRRRFLAACGVAALLAVTATAALARGWIFDSAPTLAIVNQVTPTTPTDVEFGAIPLRTGQSRNPVEQLGSMLIPDGSIYAGTLVRRADGDGGFTCVAALDGQSCDRSRQQTQ